MLHRYSEVMNLPVICADTGKNAGIVKDILFNTGSREVSAFLLEQKGLSMRKKAVFLTGLVNLGGDAAIIKSMDCVSNMKKEAFTKAFSDEGGLLGLKVYSKAGTEVGVVSDVVFDWQTGRIEGFEISDGLFQDVLRGRKLLPLLGKVEFGNEFAVVESEAVEEMEETGGGVRNKLIK